MKHPTARGVSREELHGGHGSRRTQSQSSHKHSQSPDQSHYRAIFPNTQQQQYREDKQLQIRGSNIHQDYISPHSSFARGGLIPPHSSLAQALLMGNTVSEEHDGKKAVVESPPKSPAKRHRSNNVGYINSSAKEVAPLAFSGGRNQQQQMTSSNSYPQPTQQRPKSGLSALLDHEQQQQQQEQHSSTGPITDASSNQCICNQSSSEPATTSAKLQDEADSASGPPPPPPPTVLGHSAPTIITNLPQMKNRRMAPLSQGTPPLALMRQCSCPSPNNNNNNNNSNNNPSSRTKQQSLPSTVRHSRHTSLGSLQQLGGSEHKVRRCLSSKELGTLAPPSGSPYANMLHQREALENEMTDRFRSKRDSMTLEEFTPPGKPAPIHRQIRDGEESSTTSSQKSNTSATRKAGTNETRNQRRAAHNRAVVEDLCEVVADLFVAESKLINPTKYGVSRSLGREQVLKSVQKFVAALPTRYALGADTPSEVLLHMRLMAVVRSDNSKSVVHIVNLENDSYWTDNCARDDDSSRQLRLVTICCADAVGLLEFITKLLGTGGSRVLDADVMLSSDRIALDRFVVEMNGRLRLDKVSQHIETFLRRAKEKEEHDRLHKDDCSCQEDGSNASQSINGPLYYNPESNVAKASMADRDLEEEINTAVPLTEVLASPAKNQALLDAKDPTFAQVKRHFSMPNELSRHGMPAQKHVSHNLYTPTLTSLDHHREHTMKLPLEPRPGSHHDTHLLDACPGQPEQPCPTHGVQTRPFLPLETHLSDPCPDEPKEPCATPPERIPSLCPAHGVPISPACPSHSSLEEIHCRVHAHEEELQIQKPNDDVAGQSMRQRRPLVNRRAAPDLDRMSVEGESVDYLTVPPQYVSGNRVENDRMVPLIPFEELMLIEAVGTGRVSTIYRAAWQSFTGVQMVALKVAMVNPETGDLSHVDELRREADIAARLKHPNVVDLVGVAADSECFCLAYDYCEGGSVLSLLSDTSRYYEYLPIALDVANGMAYLHSRDVIHRDLKPSNVLLTRDHRAKIADFGMSIANAGQELTAETGTYRYMAPEVIRHESYSSNADVYSFGVFLWQLITRQVPFANMTPVQAAYAVAEGRRPEFPESIPVRLKEIIQACWDQDSHKRPSFTYIAMALADFVKMSFSPASVGAQTLQIANDMLATVEGNSNINVDFTAPVADPFNDNAIGLEI